MTISDKKQTKQRRAKGLAEAEDLFGKYTNKVEYKVGKYILYDESTHRILLDNSVSDSRKLHELKTTERAPRTKVTYKEETVTKTSIYYYRETHKYHLISAHFWWKYVYLQSLV